MAVEIAGLRQDEAMTLPTKAASIQQQLLDMGIDREIIHFPEGVHTAKAAAAALGIEVGAIANSLVFWMADAPLLVMTSGRHRVDTAALAEQLGEGPIERANPQQVRAATGQVIGGVAPLGHPAPIRTIVDVALRDYPRLSAAAGTPETVFMLDYDELLRITGGEERVVGD
jgi:prolyl-tRNA editing enzyme YbaK/EbsC (Cys-tRNA(Pro) deacylase)